MEKEFFIPKRPGEPKRSCANINKVKSDIKWHPKICISKGVDKLLNG